MNWIVAFLSQPPLLLLFLVAGIGYPLGKLRIGGANLGVAAVLFVGLAFGAIDPALKLPDIIYTLGLVLFVYTIGLSSGSLFFASLRSKGLVYNLLVLGGALFGALLMGLLGGLLQFKNTVIAGGYTGSLSVTAALAGVIEFIKNNNPADVAALIESEPIVAYSITYPMGAMGVILAVYVLQRWWKIDYQQENREHADLGASQEPLDSQTILVQIDPRATIQQLVARYDWDVVFGRLQREGEVSLTSGNTRLLPGDRVSVIAVPEVTRQIADKLGRLSEVALEFDTSLYDKQRIFISSAQIAGKRLGELRLLERFGSVVTRLRRGDMEMLPHGQTVLLLGDQVRVVAPRDRMAELRTFLGDSYRAVSELDIMTFSLGLALGLLIGLIPIPLPGGINLRLGVAGGPLISALVLGAVGRTGRKVWQIPYSANLTLRQIGLVLFLAGVGTRSGYEFLRTLTQGNGVVVFAVGAVVTLLTAFLSLWIGYKVLKIPMGLLIGIVSGLHTQPAALGFSLEQAKNELPNIGYATVYPVALLVKIILAQVLMILFR